MRVTDPVTGAVSYTYGLAGQRLTLTLPGGGTWTYGYSPASPYVLEVLGKDDPNAAAPMLKTITDDQGRQVEYHLDLLGALHEVVTAQVFDANLNRINYLDTLTTLDQNQAATLSHRSVQTLANTWASKSQQGQWQWSTQVQNDYTYDLGGQRLTNTITSAGGSYRTEQYGYDELNRLKTVDYGDGQTQSYALDAMGNRTSKVDSVNGTEGYTVNAANMLLTRAGNSYANDLDGNTLTGGGRTNTWDSQNRLVQCVNGANTSSFVYGADGLRRQSTVNGTTTDFALDNSMFVRERRASSNIATYLVGARGPEYRRDDVSGSVRWYLYDGLGSVLGEVDPNGVITSSRKYDVYGGVRGGVNPGGTSKHKFVGQLGHPSEDETGLVYMQARYYDPASGRFASEDSGRHGSNWYCYCNNNSTNSVDKNGCEPTIEFVAALIDHAAMVMILHGLIMFLGGLLVLIDGIRYWNQAMALAPTAFGVPVVSPAILSAMTIFLAQAASLMAVGASGMSMGILQITLGYTLREFAQLLVIDDPSLQKE